MTKFEFCRHHVIITSSKISSDLDFRGARVSSLVSLTHADNSPSRIYAQISFSPTLLPFTYIVCV